jgi:hypothetical protein
MSPTIEVPYTADDLDAAIEAAYGYQGYVDQDGDSSNGSLADAITKKVLNHKVSKKTERVGTAIRRDKLMAELFPNVAGPDDYGTQPNPDLAKALYEALRREMWGLCKTDPNGAVQQRVGNHGLVLCRMSLSGNKTQDACYVTDDWLCIAEDLAPGLREKAFNTSERFGENMAMVANRLPQFATRAKKEFDTGMQVALQAGANALAPALTAATTSDNGSGEAQ